MHSYHLSLLRCAERYQDMYGERDVSDPFWNFLMEFEADCRDEMPVPKLCRWLGYIQGILIERGFTTVETERDWTRPLFRPLDFPESKT